MKRRLIPFLVAALASLAFCSSASAAVVLDFTEAKHEQATINRGDEYATYSVKLKNIGATTSSGQTNVAISLPPGAVFSLGTGTEWTCYLTANTCSSPKPVNGGAEFPTLKMRVWLFPEEAPDTVTAGFTGFGGGAATHCFAQDSFTFGPEVPFAVSAFMAKAIDPLGNEYDLAGGHPYAATSVIDLSTHISPRGEPVPVENLRDLYFELPPGFVANPETADICTFVRVQEGSCPDSSIVGGIKIVIAEEFGEPPAPLYRIEPEEGYPAAFAIRPVPISGLTYVLRAKLRANGDYGVTAVSPLPPQAPRFLKVEQATLCGYGPILQSQGPGVNPQFLGCKKPGEPGARTVPALTNPTRCTGELPTTRVRIDSYQQPGIQNAEGFPELSDPRWKSAEAAAPQNTDCAALSEAWAGTGPTAPSFSFQPDSSRAAAPASYNAHLHIPQDGLTEETGRATAHLKDTTVTLPAGIALNPSAADGLGACSKAQAGYLGDGFGSPNPMRFSTVSAGCPEDSKVGVAEVSTPILAEPLQGAVYLAAQDENPFGSRFAIYLVIDDKVTGIKATLAGKVVPNLLTGQITTTFKNNPQAPIEDVDLSFFGGPLASLANPDVCATYTTNTALTPWSAANPDFPTAAETATPASAVSIDAPAAGQAACPTTKAQRPFNLGFVARSTNPLAGAHTPFEVRITRPEGSQELSGVSVTTPPGFAATLRGVATCSQAAIDAAAAKAGKAEMASPSCPASSQIGTTTIGAGAGPNPYYVKTGRVYLAGPYNSAPLSLAFIVPAVAGPFDLGVQVVRTALNVNPKTAQITAVSDPIPQILDGVPLQIRDVRVDLDRPGFSLNPTSCEASAITARITGGSGAVTDLANRFQVGGCENLNFKPDLDIRLHGGTKRSDYQRLEATVTYPKGSGYANVARAAVTLPHSAFLAQEHIRTVCTRVQFAADQCPKGSIYGHAEATTPLLEEELSGPVYLRSSDNPLPDLVVALKGPDTRPIEVELSGRTDSKNGGIRNTFDMVPDAPVSKFTLELFGGKKSLIVNSRNLCQGAKQRATVKLTAHNGKQRNFRPVVGNDCRKGRAKK